MGDFREPYLDILFDADSVTFGHDMTRAPSPSTRSGARVSELCERPGLVLSVLSYAFKAPKERLSRFAPEALSAGLGNLFDGSFAFAASPFHGKFADRNDCGDVLGGLAEVMCLAWTDHVPPILRHRGSVPFGGSYPAYLCYMFWDVATIPHGCGRGVIDACVKVMAECARASNPAVVEGALHGLGHSAHIATPDMLASAIERRRRFGGEIGMHLDRYAETARRGIVQ